MPVDHQSGFRLARGGSFIAWGRAKRAQAELHRRLPLLRSIKMHEHFCKLVLELGEGAETFLEIFCCRMYEEVK